MGGFSAALSLARDGLDAWASQTGVGITAWFLAAIFAISGIAKLRRPALAAMAMVDFGVVRRVRPAWGRALGAGELALAIALPIFPYPAGIVAALLLWTFAALIVRSLLGGNTFACFCFGDSDSYVSWWTLMRTAALAVAATVLASSVDSEIVHLLQFDTVLRASLAAALIGIAVLGSRVPSLLRWNDDPYAERAESST